MKVCKSCKITVQDDTVKTCPKCHRPLLKRVSTNTGIKIIGGIFGVGLLMVIIFGSLGSMYGGSSNTGNNSVSTKAAANGSPVPTKDPCEQYLGTPQMVDCMKMQDALEKGNATRYPLKAKLSFNSTALYITNTETQEWDQCTATVNETDPQADNFQSDGFLVKPGQTVSVGWGNFANAEQVRFNSFQTKPQTIDLDCQVGGTTDPKTGAYSGGQEHRSIFNL